MNQIVLDLEVFIEELRGLGAVGVDAADFGRRDKDIFGLFRSVKIPDSPGVQQVQFRPGPTDQPAESLPFQFAPDGASHQAAMTRYINARVRGYFGRAHIGSTRWMKTGAVHCLHDSSGVCTAHSSRLPGRLPSSPARSCAAGIFIRSARAQ